MDRGGGSPSSTPGSSYPDAVDKGRGEESMVASGKHLGKYEDKSMISTQTVDCKPASKGQQLSAAADRYDGREQKAEELITCR